jgi:hypothetical protein
VQHLAGSVGPLLGLMEHHIKNSVSFVQKLRMIHLQKTDTLVSFDVVPLFTKVPLNDTLQLLEQHFERRMIDLFRQVLTSTYFLFEGKFYEQTDDVAMGSPPASVMANFYMSISEK